MPTADWQLEPPPGHARTRLSPSSSCTSEAGKAQALWRCTTAPVWWHTSGQERCGIPSDWLQPCAVCAACPCVYGGRMWLSTADSIGPGTRHSMCATANCQCSHLVHAILCGTLQERATDSCPHPWPYTVLLSWHGGGRVGVTLQLARRCTVGRLPYSCNLYAVGWCCILHATCILHGVWCCAGGGVLPACTEDDQHHD